jgi:hypothetical protein
MSLLTEEEKNQYKTFVEEQVKLLGCLDLNSDDVIWHYTTGDNLLSIVQSDTLYSTQVACLNDSSEVRYANDILRKVFIELEPTLSTSDLERLMLRELIKAGSEEPAISAHIPSWWFVTCFSKQMDDLNNGEPTVVLSRMGTLSGFG